MKHPSQGAEMAQVNANKAALAEAVAAGRKPPIRAAHGCVQLQEACVIDGIPRQKGDLVRIDAQPNGHYEIRFVPA
jgi:hypothetical protein